MIFARTDWPDAAPHLGPLIQPGHRTDFVADVEAGRVWVWRVTGSGWITYLATRVELLETGPELVFEAIAGSHAADIVRQALGNARAVGIKTARFETPHPEAVAARLLRGTGFKRAATLFRAEL